MQEITKHDYKTDLFDLGLKIYKKLNPNAEVRHDQLAKYAHFAHLLPKSVKWEASKLSYDMFENSETDLKMPLRSPLILAAGANKYGEHLPDFSKIGFAAVSVGTATKEERDGNPFRPRVRMLEKERMIQNSMGLNNPGIDKLMNTVEKSIVQAHDKGLSLGVSIAETPGLSFINDRIDDVLYSFEKAYAIGDYIEINASCPNTGHSRVDGDGEYLWQMFQKIADLRKSHFAKPIFAKLSPDLTPEQMDYTLDVLQKTGVDGVVLFNTFPGAKIADLEWKKGMEPELQKVTEDGAFGGLSGRKLYENVYKGVKWLKENYPDMKVIASGGVDHGYKAYDLMKAGADAVQCYSVVAFRYMAPHKILNEFQEKLESEGYANIQEFLKARGK